MEKFTNYLSERKLTIRGFAKSAGMSPSFLCEVLATDEAKRKKPSVDMALKIQAATDGGISVKDWPHLVKIADAVHSSRGMGLQCEVQGAGGESGGEVAT